jgi:hypothetical protein
MNQLGKNPPDRSMAPPRKCPENVLYGSWTVGEGLIDFL